MVGGDRNVAPSISETVADFDTDEGDRVPFSCMGIDSVLHHAEQQTLQIANRRNRIERHTRCRTQPVEAVSRFVVLLEGKERLFKGKWRYPEIRDAP